MITKRTYNLNEKKILKLYVLLVFKTTYNLKIRLDKDKD